MSVLPFLQQQAAVVSAEAQRVAQGVPDVRRTALVGHHIQIAVRVRGLIVDGGGEEAVLQAQGGEDGFHGAGGSQHMSGHGLGGAHGQLIGVRAKHGFHRGGLPGVVEMGGGEAAIEKQIAMGKLTAVIVFYPCWTRILSMNMTCS